jgi:GNAT superfamily N-acetyltransferase
VSEITFRPVKDDDVERAGDVNFLAFYRTALLHGLPPVVTSPLESRRYIRYLLGFDPLGGVVAEEDERIVGVAWVHPRGPVATVGPVAVDPMRQGRGIGKQLLERCIELAGRGLPQVRLVQESFNTISLGLYVRAGFRVVAPLLELELPLGTTLPETRPVRGSRLRPAASEDRARLVTRDARAFGAQRPQSIDLYLRRGRVIVADGSGGITGYVMGIGFEGTAYLGSACADDGELLVELVTAMTQELAGPKVAVRCLVPATDRRLVDCLTGLGFRIFRACHYMVRGGGTAPPPNYVLMNGDMM